MDSTCAILNADVKLVKVSKVVGGNRGGFWGESTRGSLNSRFLSIQPQKKSKTDISVRKFKPGVACAVLTPDINKEALVMKKEKEEAIVFVFF